MINTLYVAGSKSSFPGLKEQNINLKKKKKVYLEDSQYLIEEVRKKVIDDLTYEKVYKQGFNINTPIDLSLQKIATKSLRNGLLSYDKRKGWRGPLVNIKNYKKNAIQKPKNINQIIKIDSWAKLTTLKKIKNFYE